jgi:2'-hydroxyisoflavone reductase
VRPHAGPGAGRDAFVGRSFVEEALVAGHEVTLFNRGKTRPELFPGVERIRGDRGKDLSALAGRSWDAVFDPSCYVPRLARMSAEALGDAAPHYTFVSTLSVYAEETVTGQDETGRLATIDDAATEDVTGETYGALKVLAENEIVRVHGDRALIVRPGYICGPYDNLDRMPYWLRRVARGGEVLAPESPGFPVQLIDARDIARFALAMAERGAGGVFNLCAPQEPFAFGDLLDAAARVAGARDVRFTWASSEFLLESGLHEWEALPWWVPPPEVAVTRFDASRALAAGLEVRPIDESFRDCWTWDLTRVHGPLRRDVGLPPEREAELLDAWHAQMG